MENKIQKNKKSESCKQKIPRLHSLFDILDLLIFE